IAGAITAMAAPCESGPGGFLTSVVILPAYRKAISHISFPVPPPLASGEDEAMLSNTIPVRNGLAVKPLIVWAAVLGGLALAVLAPWGLSAAQAQLLGITLVTLSLWGTALVPGY